MIAEAMCHPHAGFIGVEPFVNGMAKALAAIEAEGLANIRLHFDDAVHLIDWLPPDALARVDLLFPDPWPKRRHWKRRFVGREVARARAAASAATVTRASRLSHCRLTTNRRLR